MYRNNFPIRVFLSLCNLHPSTELKSRLEFRATESAEALQDRLNKAAYEISFRHHFNKIIINDNLQRACEEARHVIGDFLEASTATKAWYFRLFQAIFVFACTYQHQYLVWTIIAWLMIIFLPASKSLCQC